MNITAALRQVSLTTLAISGIGQAWAKEPTGSEMDAVATKFERLLLIEKSDYTKIPQTQSVYHEALIKEFNRAVAAAESFDFVKSKGVVAYMDFKVHAETEIDAATKKRYKDDQRLAKLFSDILPILAYAYQTPGPQDSPNPYYQDASVLTLYLKGLDYCYSRGLTEDAWLIDHNGHGSAVALAEGYERKSGDFASLALNFGGFIQGIYLMRDELQDAGVYAKYRGVVRNLVINHGEMFQTFFEQARPGTGVRYGHKVGEEFKYYLNADGMRLFVDYFIPYFLMIEDSSERAEMQQVLSKVLRKNIAILSGTRGTIKPDGTGYHHNNAYVGAYSPYSMEVMAQALYLLSTLDLVADENSEALKLALQRFRVMAHKYDVTSALRGRLLKGNRSGAALAINKSLAFLAHPSGLNDSEMQSRFSEYFDADHFFSTENIGDFYKGKRGVPIRGLGIFRLIHEVQALDSKPAAVPAGAFIQPYASGAFFRRDGWLVNAKGFSTYLWDYEGPLNKHQNSFGQNWSYGMLEVYSADTAISSIDSGYDLRNGWDWYHVPGTTASHYPIEKRSKKAVTKKRKDLGIKRRELHRSYNSKTFVGGASIGEHGIFAVDLEAVPFTSKTDLTARKTYFFVGDKVLAMGRKINGGTAEDETHTTLFQTALSTPQDPSTLGSQTLTSLSGDLSKTELPLTLSDSVGNGYLLTESSTPLTLRRATQKSMSESYKVNEGDFVTGFLNHGIKPQNHQYTYVIVPGDSDGSKLRALAAAPSKFYQILADDDAHVVSFPEHQVTAYAFYQAQSVSPSPAVIQKSNLPCTVITQAGSNDNQLSLAASVPDLGWEKPGTPDFVTLRYAGQNFFTQEAKEHQLTLSLRGKWKLKADSQSLATAAVVEGATEITITCKDGLTQVLELERAR